MGKGGGALSAWLKEFTALVFTQTIQAFIYAIIITIILYGMGGDKGGTVGANDNNTALGLMATFALLSVFKVEDLTRKIFGISDTKASHGNALKSIMKLKFAADIGKRTLNNAGKFLGGIGKINKAGQDRRKLKKRLDEDMQDEMSQNGQQSGASGGPVYGGAGVDADNDSSGAAFGGAGSYSSGSSGAVGGGANANHDAISSASRRRMRNALRNYEDQLSAINKSRDEGIKDMISSVVESQGAIFGGAVGAVLGGSDGNFDEAVAGLMAGAGVGDMLGKGTIDTIDRATQFVRRNYNREAGVRNKELKAALKNYKDAMESRPTYNHTPSLDDM